MRRSFSHTLHLTLNYHLAPDFDYFTVATNLTIRFNSAAVQLSPHLRRSLLLHSRLRHSLREQEQRHHRQAETSRANSARRLRSAKPRTAAASPHSFHLRHSRLTSDASMHCAARSEFTTALSLYTPTASILTWLRHSIFTWLLFRDATHSFEPTFLQQRHSATLRTG